MKATSFDTDRPADGSGSDQDDDRTTREAIEADSALSGAAEQQGGAALSNVGKSRPVDRMFKPDVV